MMGKRRVASRRVIAAGPGGFALAVLVTGLFVPVALAQSAPPLPLTVPPVRDTEPVVLTGAQFPLWAAPADLSVATPSIEGLQCLGEDNGVPTADLFGDTPLTSSEPCSHSRYDDPLLSTQDLVGAEGVPVNRLLGYRWTGERFEQIPFQVDEMFTRHLSNNASGFSFYSGRDRHESYAFDREGWRWSASHPDDPCLAAPASELSRDPVPGLDTDDELVFMARDLGPQAPMDAARPAGIEEMAEVVVADAVNGEVQYAYVGLAGDDGPAPAFDAASGYVRYQRDADADVFLFSQSSYSNYGNAPHGPWFDPATGVCHDDPAQWRQRRPGDQATVATPRYRFRYDGRWLMTDLRMSGAPDGDWTYGDDLVDQWKARAFQQRPGGTTPCCGFEEEVNNWGGSSILLGEKAGPVRVIRETWGSDSATNLVRREVFYRDEIRQTSFLRVHVIPPLDGIYVQWDHNAMAVDTYYNPFVPDGVPIDGVNDEVFGNSYIGISESGFEYDGNDTISDVLKDLLGGPITIGDPNESCEFECVRNDVDTPDPTLSGVNGLLMWEQVDGPTGTLVTRWSSSDITPGGAAHALVAAPYYRDDACFDDGTGSDPGPHLASRRPDTGSDAQWVDADGVVRDRECWDVDRHRAAMSDPDDDYDTYLGTRRFFQGSIGTHGMHLLLIADSDNLLVPFPLTEIVAEQRIVTLPPQRRNVGEAYGRAFELPLLALVVPTQFGPATGDPGDPGDPDERIATGLRWDGDNTHRPQGAELAAVLTTADDGDPVADRLVRFDVDGTTHEAVTDATGRASTFVNLRNGVDHEVTAIFDGDDDHLGSSTSAVVAWSPGQGRGQADGPAGKTVGRPKLALSRSGI